MAWQNELQHLDEELAAGRLAAEEYRRRRDELLSQAASTSQAAGTPAATPANEAAPGSATVPAGGAPADGPDPFPAPFRWEPTPSESTQVMRPVTDEGDNADRTQVVAGQSGAAAPTDGERTQVVPGQTGQGRQGPGPGGPPGQPGPGQQGPGPGPGQPGQRPFGPPPWGYQDPNNAQRPPWANADAPPFIEQSPSWIRQGPELFEASGGSSNRMRVVALAAVAVLVVGALVAGGFWLAQRDTGPAAAPTTTQSPPPPTTTTRELPDPPPVKPRPETTTAALIEPPGTVRGGGGELDLARIQAAQLFTPATIDALTQGGMTDGMLKTTTVETSTIGLFALTVSDTEAAKDVLDVIGRSNTSGGLRSDEERALKGVQIYTTAESATDHVYRALYVLYDRVIEVEVFGPDRAAVQELFDGLLENQLELAPPSVR